MGPFLVWLRWAGLIGLCLGHGWGVAGTAAETPPWQPTSPREYQVFQRASRGHGLVTVAGAFPAATARGDQLDAQWKGQGVEGGWTSLLVRAGDGDSFRTEIRVPAGGWYRLQLRWRRGDLVLAEAAMEHVGVGEVFVIAGQSNSANHGEEKQVVQSGMVSVLAGDHWQLANDPQPGASGGGGSFVPPFGDALAAKLQVPIGIVACGMGGTSVREWLPKGSAFPYPPTVLGNVQAVTNGGWESRGVLFDAFVARIQPLGLRGFRAVLWHQGESDANQKDTSRTLSGPLYREYFEKLRRATYRVLGWEPPWFVAQVSYHVPGDESSPEIRAAQASLWRDGLALEGPDSDALRGEFRDSGGMGVHFSGSGLREHAARWVNKVVPWLERQLATGNPAFGITRTHVTGPSPRLELPGAETFTVADRPAFVFLPPVEKRRTPQPWVFYGPTLPGYPDGAEGWMHEQFLAAGVAIAGVDVGEAYGSPHSHPAFEALYQELTGRRGFAVRPCLLGRSRGGLWVSSWAIAHPERVAGLAGIYPVFDFKTYPGLAQAAPAYGLSAEVLAAQAETLNPVARLDVLARAKIPTFLIHGDRDTVVPLAANSAEYQRRYQAASAERLVQLVVLEGQGHSFHEGYFLSQELVDFVVERARVGAQP